jgi:hypothetical protein
MESAMTDSILASLRAALEARPEDTTLRMALARRLLESGDLPAAMTEAAEALRYDSSCAEARDFMLSALAQPRPDPAQPVQPAPAEAVPVQQSGSAPAAGFDWSAAEQQVAELASPRFVDESGEDPGASGAFDVERPTLLLADVGGMQTIKERLELAFLAPMRNPELRRLYGKSLRGGLLLYGPPRLRQDVHRAGGRRRTGRTLHGDRNLRSPRHVHRTVRTQPA